MLLRHTSVAVIGGGMLGMTLARGLRAGGAAVTVLEGAPRSGGLTVPASFAGYTWDRFYHVILPGDSHLLALLEELGLSNQIRWRPVRTGFYTNGRLHSLSSTLDFIRFPALSWLDKLRLAATILHASRLQDWRPLEKILAVDWLRRWSGRRAVERIWLPLLRAKLGANAELASAAFIWATIARLYGARQTPVKRELFGYVEGGYATILARLEERLSAEGIRVRSGARVTAVRAQGRGVLVELDGGERQEFDAVVLTLTCGQVATICAQLTAAEQERLRQVRYQGILCAALLLKRPLAPYYVTNITEGWVPFTGVVEMTALVDRATFGGHSLVYLPRYVTQEDPFWGREDSSIEQEFLAALARIYPGFRRDDVVTCQISRVREMLAVSTLNYSTDLAPPVDTSIPNVFVVNSAQIVNGTLNVNETIGLAEAALPGLVGQIAAGTTREPARLAQ